MSAQGNQAGVMLPVLYPGQTQTVQIIASIPSVGVPVPFRSTVFSDSPNTNGQAVFTANYLSAAVPALTATKTHSSTFFPGQRNATYTVTVSNAGAADASSGIAVSEQIPEGLSLVSMSSTDPAWTCGSPLPSVCTRSDTLTAGSSYSPIIVTVNVSTNAPPQVTNTICLSAHPQDTLCEYEAASDLTNISPVRVRGDFGGNGVPSVLLQFPDGSMGVWYMAQANRYLSITNFAFLAGPSSGISLVNVADLNRDGTEDLILRFGNGSLGVWYMGGPLGRTISSFAFISGPIQNWNPVAMADLNNDGYLDLLIQNTDGTVGVWYLGSATGNQITGFAPISGPIAGWKVVGSADLNHDGQPDILLQYSDGSVGVWYMSGLAGNQVTKFALIAGASNWTVVGVADMDGDGHPDLLIRNKTDGTLGLWYLGGAQGNQITGFALVTIPGHTDWIEFTAH